MFVADRNGANPEQVPLPRLGVRERDHADAFHHNNPVWSPDGEWVYFASGAEPQNEMDVDLWRVRPSGGPPQRLTNQHAAANYPVVIDQGTVLYVARDADGAGPWLWSLDVEHGTTARISSGIDQYHVHLRESRRPADGRDRREPELEPLAGTAADPDRDRGRCAAVLATGANGMDAGATLQPRGIVLPVGERNR